MTRFRDVIRLQKLCEEYANVPKIPSRNAWIRTSKKTPWFPGACLTRAIDIITGLAFMDVYPGTDFSRPPWQIRSQWENKVESFIRTSIGLCLWGSVPDLRGSQIPITLLATSSRSTGKLAMLCHLAWEKPLGLKLERHMLAAFAKTKIDLERLILLHEVKGMPNWKYIMYRVHQFLWN